MSRERNVALIARRNTDAASLGRRLARRARSCCELCGSSGTPLQPWEITPLAEDPDPDAALLLCKRCESGALGDALDAKDWRFLEAAAWSEFPAVQVLAVRLLRRMPTQGWARELLESVYLDDAVALWVEGTPPTP